MIYLRGKINKKRRENIEQKCPGTDRAPHIKVYSVFFKDVTFAVVFFICVNLFFKLAFAKIKSHVVVVVFVWWLFHC